MALAKGGFISLSSEILTRGYGLRFQAQGRSMTPCIPSGSVIQVNPAEISSLHPGDVILYRTAGQMVAHRLIGKQQRHGKLVLITRGDILPRTTVEHLTPEQVLGRVEVVEWSYGLKLRIDRGLGRRLGLLLARISPFLYPGYLALAKIKRVLPRLFRQQELSGF